MLGSGFETRRAAKSGLTLLEVVVTMAILAAGLLTLFEYQSATHRLAGALKTDSLLIITARSLMEDAIASEGKRRHEILRGEFGAARKWSVEFRPRDGAERDSFVVITVLVSDADREIRLETERYWPAR